MYNLIVGGDFDQGQNEFLTERLFEYTDDNLKYQFRTNITAALEKMSSFPSLFMSEGINDEIARVGTVIRPRIAGRKILFEVNFDADIPPLNNRTLFENQVTFAIDHDFEFSRTHWAVKQADLYKALYRVAQPRRRKPVVFRLPEPETVEDDLVSVMMPFRADFDPVYEAIRAGATKLGMRCQRADEIWDNPAVI